MILKIPYNYIIEVTKNNSIIFWTDLYELLGVEGILLAYNQYDVKNIKAPANLIEDIRDIMLKNAEISKDKRIKFYNKDYRKIVLGFDYVNYSPTTDNNIDTLGVIINE